MRTLALVVADISRIASRVRSAFFSFSFPALGVEAFFVSAGVTLNVREATRRAALLRLLHAQTVNQNWRLIHLYSAVRDVNTRSTFTGEL